MEQEVIRNTPLCVTIQSMVQDLKTLGIRNGDRLIVHVSLKKIGWIAGGAVAVIKALQQAVGEEGTIIMPAQSGSLTDPAGWCNPPVPEEWVDIIRAEMPPFHPAETPTYRIGVTPEVFRSFPNVKRSNHPHLSFCAWGKNAEQLMENHPLSFGLGPNSPLQKMYDQGAKVLFLGTSYDSATAFHLAEYDLSLRKVQKQGAPLLMDGKRQWVEFEEIELDSDEFEEVGDAFERELPNDIAKGKVGSADTRLFSMQIGVNFARQYLQQKERDVLMKWQGTMLTVSNDLHSSIRENE